MHWKGRVERDTAGAEKARALTGSWQVPQTRDFAGRSPIEREDAEGELR